MQLGSLAHLAWPRLCAVTGRNHLINLGVRSRCFLSDFFFRTRLFKLWSVCQIRQGNRRKKWNAVRLNKKPNWRIFTSRQELKGFSVFSFSLHFSIWSIRNDMAKRQSHRKFDCNLDRDLLDGKKWKPFQHFSNPFLLQGNLAKTRMSVEKEAKMM